MAQKKTKKESVESKKESVQIEFIEENPEIIYTDVIQINLSNEAVVFSLSLRNKDNKTANVSHRVYMTLPHFIRFADTTYNLAGQAKKLLEDDNDTNAS